MSVKQVIVVRKDLNMRKGKIVAQGCHASMSVILNMMSKETDSLGDNSVVVSRTLSLDTSDSRDMEVDQWLSGSFTKICVSCDSEEELLELHTLATAASIPCSLITDNGLTEFNGVPTNTCIAIGPADSELIDKITGDLKLL